MSDNGFKVERPSPDTFQLTLTKDEVLFLRKAVNKAREEWAKEQVLEAAGFLERNDLDYKQLTSMSYKFKWQVHYVLD